MKLLTHFMLIGALAFAGASHAQDYKRIASAGGDITEIIYALGAGDQVIAVDSTSGFPETVKDKAQIGYVRGLSAEGVLSIAPDLLIGADDMGPPNVIDNLRAANLDVAVAPLGHGADRVVTKIKFVGETLGLQSRADDLIADYSAKMAALADQVGALETKPKVLFILSMRDGAPIVGGAETSAHDIIELAGGVNVGQDFTGWKPMNSEALIAANPDVIVMSASHAENMGDDSAVLGRADVKLTNAGKSARLVKMDAMLLLGFGPRTPIAVAELMHHIHPHTH
ncbi:hypothetical protein GCM10008927_18480 [Amylibacter ulvae]|uniref:Fe/B12 periplasmic-binding domain-containing protein n=1 Tax=Paramylibacter ulvae TaxID=1651968 RepID=A0ABQ3D704_9RHOB|nr:ABC transporter substrate-binding protein [Amylibacter ulvae]GHA53007.1 hypothetical protein GCM10008927_18480 [Amylibacter ulvae]